jgi:hypothetical protein
VTAIILYPSRWQRACPGCGLVGIVEGDTATTAADPAHKPPRQALAGWWCPCGSWVELVGKGRR